MRPVSTTARIYFLREPQLLRGFLNGLLSGGGGGGGGGANVLKQERKRRRRLKNHHCDDVSGIICLLSRRWRWTDCESGKHSGSRPRFYARPVYQLLFQYNKERILDIRDIQ